MADFKTAEQYVVEKVEYLERELDETSVAHKLEVAELNKALEEKCAELAVAYNILNAIRDRLNVRPDSYWGGVMSFETLYRKENIAAFDDILNYFDISLDNEEDEEDE
jgi:hypothetical protein